MARAPSRSSPHASPRDEKTARSDEALVFALSHERSGTPVNAEEPGLGADLLGRGERRFVAGHDAAVARRVKIEHAFVDLDGAEGAARHQKLAHVRQMQRG